MAYVDDVSVRAEPNAWPGHDGVATRVMPVRVTIQNNSGRPVRIRYSDFSFVDSKGRRYSVLPPFEVQTGGDSFDLCPADACLAQPGRKATRMTAVDPPPALIRATERIVEAAGLDVGSVEVVIDDRNGTPRFYDINALSNFVADPVNVLGWDPHENLVEFLQQAMKGRVAA